MPSLFDGIFGSEEVSQIYKKIETNYPGSPHSKSGSLWLLRRASDIRSDNRSAEKMLEKAVAMLAERDHMPGWHNQCPVASGIVSSSSDRNSAVDLVKCSSSGKDVRLIELKWDSDTPVSALQQVLVYGIAYLFCRVHKRELPLHYRSLMNARHIALEVVAPRHYYGGIRYGGIRRGQLSADTHAWLDQFETNELDVSPKVDTAPLDIEEFLAETNRSLNGLARAKTNGELTMSLNALAFPDEFDELPFGNGQEVRRKCGTRELSEEGKLVRNAFAGLAPAWPTTIN